MVGPDDFKMVVSNIGIVPDFSSLYTTNAGPYTATIQVQLQDDHKISSFDYMDRVRREMTAQFPEIRTFFSSGSMVDAILNSGMPAPIDVQVSSPRLSQIYPIAQDLASRIRQLARNRRGLHSPGHELSGHPAGRGSRACGRAGAKSEGHRRQRHHGAEFQYQIAPNYWVDRPSGNDYFLTVQYYEHGPAAIHNFFDLSNIPLRAPEKKKPADLSSPARFSGNRPTSSDRVPATMPTGVTTMAASRTASSSSTSAQANHISNGPVRRPLTTLDSVVKVEQILTPTEVDHYQIQRVVDVYVTPAGEDLGKVSKEVQKVVADAKLPGNVRIALRGMVNGMNESFKSFAIGFLLSVILLFLILVAQFRSFIDPFLIMLAIPMGFIGVLVILPLTHTTLNVMSLMGVLMLVGVAASNSILIVDFAHQLEEQGYSVRDAVITSCRVRLRPILMTSLATIIGMIPMALKLGTGTEQYAPMARAIIGGLTSSVMLTVFIVPAAYLLVYGHKDKNRGPEGMAPAVIPAH